MDPAQFKWYLYVSIGSPLLLAFVAFFGEAIWRWIRRPKLEALVDFSPPYCKITPIINTQTGETVARAYYFTFSVKNIGRTSAKWAEVFAKKLKREKRDGTYEIVGLFPPGNLLVSDTRDIRCPFINPNAARSFTVFHVTEPSKRNSALLVSVEDDNRDDIIPGKAIIHFDIISKSTNKGYLQPPAKYQMEIEISAENAKARIETFEIDLAGDWFDEEERMFREGVAFKLLNNKHDVGY